MKEYKDDFNIFLTAVGSKIKKHREESLYTQEKLAEAAEIEYKYYQKIENGQKNITLKTLYKICKVLKIKPKDLLDN